jgi:hypothetical protein
LLLSCDKKAHKQNQDHQSGRESLYDAQWSAKQKSFNKSSKDLSEGPAITKQLDLQVKLRPQNQRTTTNSLADYPTYQ